MRAGKGIPRFYVNSFCIVRDSRISVFLVMWGGVIGRGKRVARLINPNFQLLLPLFPSQPFVRAYTLVVLKFNQPEVICDLKLSDRYHTQ
jgi:hypothetical protein